MIEYINGNIAEATPTYVIIDLHGMGYLLHISLTTYTALGGKKETKLFVHEVIREDAYTLYGFQSNSERELFRLLISVSGIGANTGMLFLSSMSPDELRVAIITGDIDKLKSVKGVGLKTAQRLVVELKDKLSKDPVLPDIFMLQNNTAREEALSALVTLGFGRKDAEKAVDKIVRAEPTKPVEQIIKDALKQM
jgi:holliday junction DNA helicase RuvA